MSIDGVVLLSIDFWFMLSIAAAWRVSIDTSLVDLRIVHESAGSFFEEPRNPLFIVVLAFAISHVNMDRASIDAMLLIEKQPHGLSHPEMDQLVLQFRQEKIPQESHYGAPLACLLLASVLPLQQRGLRNGFL
ncbi:hypothetical protein DY000_02023665 [Brassica cretica]|uniref:Uncharacterized protein n=1 Tax=Brassica cretica TaxID=69181 RepID=A0ABQ7E5Z1_BRACR|nr:hypothetical protein DY000_02023665 [Brassica cretica]